MRLDAPSVLPSKPLERSLAFSAFFLILGAVLLAPQGDVAQVAILHRFWLATGVMGVGFALSWGVRSLSSLWFWGVAIATRLLLLPMAPGSDVWRYLWEGYIQTLGFNPYQLAPDAVELEPFRTAWWGQINHADVAAIYPPITQLGFWLLAAIAPNLYLFKAAFVLADLLVCGLLSRRFGYGRSTLYAWNPMVIYSFAGGAHYDSWFILPLVMAWLVIEREPSTVDLGIGQKTCTRAFDWFWGALLVGMSVAVKWVSLPLVGFLVWRSLHQRKDVAETEFPRSFNSLTKTVLAIATGRKWIQSIFIGLLGVLPMGLSALPYCTVEQCSLIPTRSTFVSHGRSAEFIPHFVAKLWPTSLQANWIYLIPLALFLLWLTVRASDFREFAEWYWFGLLMITPIIHFWYFTWMIPFAVATQNWGVRLVSLSAFIYFVMPSRLPDWWLTTNERLFLWLPLVLGWLWTVRQNARKPQS